MPVLNDNYARMARHYGTAVMPARPYKPKDKSKVENAVLIVEGWLLMRLRHEHFYTLSSLNLRIRLNQALKKSWFDRLGLLSLLECHRQFQC
jgi:transposase